MRHNVLHLWHWLNRLAIQLCSFIALHSCATGDNVRTRQGEDLEALCCAAKSPWINERGSLRTEPVASQHFSSVASSFALPMQNNTALSVWIENWTIQVIMFSSPWLQSVALVGLCFCYLATAQTTTTSKPATTSTAATPELTAFFNYPTLGSTYRYHANDVVILDVSIYFAGIESFMWATTDCGWVVTVRFRQTYMKLCTLVQEVATNKYLEILVALKLYLANNTNMV